MRRVLTISLLLISMNLLAEQPTSKNLTRAVMALDRAFLGNDSVKLGQLLDDSLTYGHSNGWIQSKKEVIGDLFNGKLSYKEINLTTHQVVLDGNIAWVRVTDDLDVIFNGNPLKLKLNVLQIWIFKDEHWQLFARQSVKID